MPRSNLPIFLMSAFSILLILFIFYFLINDEDTKLAKILEQGFVVEALIIKEQKRFNSSEDNPQYELTISYKNILTNELTVTVIKSCDNQFESPNRIEYNCYQRAKIEYDESNDPICKKNENNKSICNAFSKKNHRVPFMYVPRIEDNEQLFTFDIEQVIAKGSRIAHH